MKLNYNSFFVQKYLQVTNPYDVPTNICQLGRNFLFWSFVYLLLAVVATFFVWFESYALWSFGKVLFTDALWADIFTKDSLADLSMQLFFMINGAATVAASAFGIKNLYKKWDNRRREARYKLMQDQYDKTGSYELPEPEPSSFYLFITGWYKSFKDKTCTMIEYDGIEAAKEEREKRGSWGW